ncbi:hypothetical protein MSAN_02190100 [Mycena sanguinolenta]|uniref:Uncharacterized protein n=1 Tax=Mycena sanguinolenta TaxID=230812 RepID=A0A8H7CKR0_9AGAR|nr:hypothetical protein MSAN_02190100 [Mycena sanguinolenta]
MANEDTHADSLPELTSGSVPPGAETVRNDAETPADTPADTIVPAVVDPIPVSIPLAEPNPIAPLRSSLVPLGSQATPPAPQPKRFSAVNINKKFLEKNSASSSTSAPASANSQASKASSAVVRPPSQTTTTHSRLVTTKLTIAPQSLSAPGPGWSRPSSATPPATTATTNGPAPTPPGSGDPLPSNSGPQHSHGASAMQNQSRPVPVRGPGSRESAAGGVGKPVWGNASKSHPQQRLDMTSQNDFPTAAEVAAAPRKTKPSLADRNMAKEPTAQELASAAANKLARMEQADTFRGVHLDPNAHHWDEMDADDDNFLDGVIEFGDGRQYKIESSDPPADNAPAAAAESSSSVPSRSGSRLDRDETQQLNVPVSKEERFADDFDRSWPRSRASPSVSTRDLPGGPALSTNSSNAAPSPVSPAISMTSDSASRALLFNERSNKLEPYNRGAAGAGVRRGSGGNEGGFPSPTDLRSGARDQFNRGRGFNSASGSAFGSERGQPQQQRRDGMPGPPPNAPQQSPRAPPPNPWTQRKDSNEVETRGRRTVMGPPPVPPPGGSGGRQRPPHLPLESEGGFPVRPNRRPSTSRESRVPPSAPAPAVEPSSARRAPSQSPALSHASAVAQSPVVPVPVVPPQVDLDEVRKDVMQSAAARAKARRQQEEEEREKEKERARRKAAEIEGRMKAAEAEKAAKAKRAAEEAAHAQDVLDIIESAVKSVQPDVATTTKPAAATDIPAHEQPKPPLRRPSLVGPPLHSQPPVDSRSGGPRRTSSSAPVPPPLQTSPASWRSKPSPASTTMPVTSTPVLQQPQQVLPRPSIPPIPTLVAPPSALEQVESLAENAEEREELEVVNFSDLGKFIGVTEEEAPTRDPEPEVKQRETPNAAAPAVRAPRPSAADFFDDRPPRSPEVEKTNIASWRRPNVQDPGPSLHAQPTGTGKDRLRGEASEASNAVSTAPAKDTSLSVPSTSAAAAPTPHAPSPHVNRTPRTQPFYKEATMSTLDDVMSRIKGAIDGMSSEKEHRSPEVSAVSAVTRSSSSMFHTTPTANLSLQRERWVPPAFRIRHQFDAEPQEVITTGCEPPRSPKAWKTFLVRLPKVSTQLEPVKPKQLALCTRQAQFRWDVLSFDPPVEGMSRKELTVNEILFRRTAFKGKSKYKVLLPNSRTAGPKVNIPISPRVSGVGTFGRPPAPADALSTWRKQPLVSTSKNVDLGESETGLSTMSRSPPPELPSDPNVASIPRTDLSTSSKSEDVFGSSRSRSQPKMPAGSAVAFYRDSRVDAVEPDTKPLVNFIVNSELEDSSKQSSDNTQSKKPSITVSSPSASSSLAQGEPLNIASKPFTPRANGLRLSPPHRRPKLACRR